MKNILQIEFRKVFKSRYFLLVLAILTAVVLADAWASVAAYYGTQASYAALGMNGDGRYLANPAMATETLHNRWIGGEINGIFPTVFYALLPIFVVIPYSWSHLTEVKSGYVRQVVTKTTRTNYMLAKYCAVFVSGALVIGIPLLINFLLVACFVPARSPDIMWKLYYNIGYEDLWSSIYYTNPWAYDLIYLLLPAVFGGIWATVSLTVSYFVENKFILLFAPYLALLFAAHILELSLAFIVKVEVSPLNYLHASPWGVTANGYMIAGQMTLFFVATLVITLIRSRRNDVF